MKVRMNVSMAGPDVSWIAGETVDIPGPDAERLIAAGYAEKVRERKPADKRRTATVKADETR